MYREVRRSLVDYQEFMPDIKSWIFRDQADILQNQGNTLIYLDLNEDRFMGPGRSMELSGIAP